MNPIGQLREELQGDGVQHKMNQMCNIKHHHHKLNPSSPKTL
jgi:hypothetical protein